MPVPFRRVSKTRQLKRATHQRVGLPTVVTCSNCGSKIKPHMVCKVCGYYKNQKVINVTNED